MPQLHSARDGPWSEATRLPRCFRKIQHADAKRTAQEIYESLLTVSNVLPPQMRGAGLNVCPVKLLGLKNARNILSGIQSGVRFQAQELYETSNVKFVGMAAGVLEAVRLGAVSSREATVFFGRIEHLVMTVANPQFMTISQRKKAIKNEVLMRAYGISRTGLGRFALEKWVGLWIWVNRNDGITRIETIRVIDDWPLRLD